MNADELPIQVRCAYRRMVRLELLSPHPKNPNIHPERQILLLAGLIRYHGWRAPITVSNRSGYIVRGHARYLAAKALGLAEVPVDYQDYVSEVDELADLYADNKIVEYATIDRGLEDDLLSEFRTAGFNIENAGISEKEAARHMWAPDSSVLDGAPGTGQEGGAVEDDDPGNTESAMRYECPKCGFRF